ncbi:MAG TPA: helix-turn-helix domain-containing protein [Flavisolibacter sp.]|nr:helix-turn-helix domain-containing protein [Flavisolibacter sp.]
MEMDIVTRADLQAFRIELLNDLKLLFGKDDRQASKPWLRNQEVCRLLSISSSTLKRMRISGKMKSTKVCGIHYYSYSEIESLLA